jgi:hypothetical protein
LRMRFLEPVEIDFVPWLPEQIMSGLQRWSGRPADAGIDGRESLIAPGKPMEPLQPQLVYVGVRTGAGRRG